jgi:sugar lactone lactonase YvrE
VGVAVDQTSGAIYVADSGNARVEKFDAQGGFVAAWGFGVSDGMAQSEVCTSGCQAGIVGSGAGQFSNPTSIAVDNSGGGSAGDVYVGDAGNNRVQKFDANGLLLLTIDGSTTTQGAFVSLVGVAVDQSGNLWTADGSTDNIDEFDDEGNFLQQWMDPFGQTLAIAVDSTNGAVYLIRGSQATERFTLTGENETVIDNGSGVALGLDQQGGNLYVDHGGDVAIYDSTGAFVETFSLTSSNSQGLAFGATAGGVYVSDATTDEVTLYGQPTTPGPPAVFAESATDVTESSATLNATVVPFGLDTTCDFQIVDDVAFQSSGYDTATSIPCVPADLGSSFDFVQATGAASGLASGTTFHFRVVATNSDGTTNGNDETFETAGPPVVQSESATSVTDTTATLNATIVPFGLDTTCSFQYVDDATFQSSGYDTATSVACSPEDLGSSFSPQTASASISGLTPSTTYHFRAVATSSAATVNGVDTTFATLVSFLASTGSFGAPGSASGQFQSPIGVAVDQHSGSVYVADSGNARVQKFSGTGKFIAAWGFGVTDGKAQSEVCKHKTKCLAGITGSGAGQFSSPTSIAVDIFRGPSSSAVYVGDAANDVIQKFNPNGKLLSTIDGSAAPQGHFVSLVAIAVDQSGNLWALDAGTSNVVEFDDSGNFLQQWSDPSFSPQAIAVDATGSAVYVIDNGGTTERFSLTGGDETSVDTGTGKALALNPQTGNLYVDHGNDVAIYDRSGTRLDSLFSLGPVTTSQGIAYRAADGANNNGKQDRIYLSDLTTDVVAIYAAPKPGAPFITTESAESASKTSETLKATVVPLGKSTSCTFQIVSSSAFAVSGYGTATNLPCTPSQLGSSFNYQQASATASGLTLGAFYHFRVVAKNAAGATNGPDQTFQVGPGDWTPFFRCPVDDPAMLATDGVNTVGICLASNSTHGTFAIGTTTTVTGNTNLQAGLVLNENTGVFTVIAPAGGAVISDPVQVTAGGVTVTATVESAGAPSDFSLLAGLQTGLPIIRLPVKIHLVGQSVDLGPSCFIGSDQDPIVLLPENTDLSGAVAKFESFDPDGTPNPNGPLATIVISGAVQGDDTFAVPGANGCGPNGDGTLNGVVNSVVGLPSPSGANHLVLEDASSALGLPNATLTGQQFSDFWHVAFD